MGGGGGGGGGTKSMLNGTIYQDYVNAIMEEALYHSICSCSYLSNLLIYTIIPKWH